MRPRIAIVLPSHWTAQSGGSETQARYLIDAMCRTHRYDITYIARATDPRFCPDGYRLVGLEPPSGRLGLNLTLDSHKLFKALRTVDPDVIYQRVGSPYTGVAAYYAKRTRCRMVWHIASDMDVAPMSGSIPWSSPLRQIERHMRNYGLRHANSVIAQTHDQARELELRHRRASRVIRNMHPAPEEIIDKTGKLRVVWVANMKELKRPEVFVRLAKDLADLEHVEFVMVGRAPVDERHRKQLFTQIESVKNLSHRGELEQEEVNELLAASHVLVSTSEFEGFSNVWIQAWMREIPVVSLHVNPDGILQQHGVGFCAGDYPSLRQNVLQLIEQEDLRNEMGRRARDYALETFSMRNAEEIIEVIDQQAANRLADLRSPAQRMS
jgi:glycosyltransferase involved in cell wall biosynthesis